jgi:hypothetical protein
MTTAATDPAPAPPLRRLPERNHFASAVIVRPRSVAPAAQRDPYKPRGLWYSRGSAWLEFVRREYRSAYSPRHHVYAVDLTAPVVPYGLRSRDGRRALVRLDSAQALRAFTTEFGDLTAINWAAVATKYVGIEIAPYQWSCRTSLQWYYGWDVASGCVWDADAVQLTYLGRLAEFAAAENEEDDNDGT